MSSAYIRSLQKSLAAEAQSTELSKRDVESRFLAWLDGQPAISRFRPYSMTELEKALGTQGRYLSPVLLRLGWERRRKWTSKKQYLRYWVPPSVEALP
jgi:hypothetical protein